MEIKRLDKTMLEEFKTLKLQSLKDSPLAFDTSYEEALEWTDKVWQKRFEDAVDTKSSVYFLALDGDKPVGYIRIDLKQKKKKRHIAEFDVLHVMPEYRRQGIARRLFETALNDIKENHPQIIKIQLSVYEDQKPAMEFYKKLGFIELARYEQELFYEGKYYAQYMMDLFL